jgi:hypothetical protein
MIPTTKAAREYTASASGLTWAEKKELAMLQVKWSRNATQVECDRCLELEARDTRTQPDVLPVHSQDGKTKG